MRTAARSCSAWRPASVYCAALPRVNGGGLVRLFVDSQCDAAVLQLRIGMFRRGRQEYHHRTFHFVGLRLLAAVGRFFGLAIVSLPSLCKSFKA